MTLLMMLTTATTAWADELTVYDGTTTQNYVPYIYFWDDYSKSQYIIPATALSDMAGGEISAITLYSTLTASQTTKSEADVYLMEVDYSSFSGTASFKPKSQATIVYQGKLSFNTDGETTIEFTTPFKYAGQNLLIGFENTTDAGWLDVKFYGSTSAAATIYGSDGSSPDNVTPKLVAFIPKTTFTYAISGSSCAKPTLSAGSISHKGATLTVGGGSGTYNVQYALESSDEWQDVAQNSTETTFELTGLSPLTNYKARVQSVCDDDATSNWQVVYFTTTQEVPDVSEGWSDDFEGTSCGWELINGDIANAWAWGTATNCGDGTKALYISNDGGTTNAYTNTTNSTVYAAKLLYFPKGKYQISYNWRANGESNFDYMRVALVPTSVKLTASQNVPTGFSDSALPANWIALDDGGKLNLKSDWQSKDVAVRVDGTYYLVFAWRNDNADGNNPPAAIDNVSITKLEASYNAEDLSVGSVTTTSATISWEGDAEQWQVSYADNALFQDATVTIVNANSCNITNLQPNTNYYVKVRAYLGGTDYGAWSEAFSFKSALLINTFPWKEDFESLSGNGSIPESWDNSDGTTTGADKKWCYKTGSQGPTVQSGLNGSRCIRFNSYDNANGKTNFLKTPLINLPAGEDMQLRFWYKNPAGGDFSVYISTDGGATYTTELATGLTGKDEWTEKRISLADYAGTENVVIVFKGTSNYADGDAYIYLDDVIVESKPLTLTLATVPANGGTVEMMNTVDGTIISKDQDVDGKYYVTPGTEVTVKASANTGYHLTGWSNGATVNQYDTIHVTVTKDSTITANFVINTYTLTLKSNPSDINRGHLEVDSVNHALPAGVVASGDTPYKYIVDHGTTVTINAFPIEHYHLSSWSNTGGSDLQQTVTIIEDTEITGVFAIDYGELLLNPNGPNMGTCEVTNHIGNNAIVSHGPDETTGISSYKVNYGAEVNLLATPKPGYCFVNWTEGDNVLSTDPEYTYMMTKITPQYISVTETDTTTILGNFAPVAAHLSQSGDEYTIHSAAGWNAFCDMIDGGETFSGKTVKLGADITVTRMAGSSDKPFSGTFDGQGNTLTLNYGTADNPVDAQFVAPFVMTYWNTTPIFRNLTIDGHIYEAYKGSEEAHNVGGLIGHLYGEVTIEHCTSNVEITSTGGASGFVGLCEHTVSFTDCVSSAVVHSNGGNNSGFVSWSRASGHAISFEGCVFNGKLLQNDGSGSYNGGFIGWTGSSKTVTFTNCLCAPAALADGETMAGDNSATFARGWNANTTATNSYYTTVLGSAQGKQLRSIEAGNYVNIGFSGAAKTYSVSGITAYLNSDNSFNTGLIYNNVMYAGDGDEVSLTVSNTVPESFNFSGYSVTPAEATLSGSGNDYTLTMTDADVVVTANYTIPSVNYLDMSGTKQTCTDYTVLNGTETTIGVAGEETWYVVDDKVDFDHNIGIQGDVHIILKDDAVMNVGTADKRINETGIGGSGQYKFSISIYGQSTGTNQGQLNVYATNYAIWAFGGNFNCSSASVTALVSNCFGIWAHDAYSDGTGNLNLRDATVNAIGGSYGLNARNVNISGGQVKATGYGYGIISDGDVVLDWNNGSDYIYANKYSVGGNLHIADGKYFAGEDGTAYSGTIEKVNGVYPIGGKTLQPHIPGSVDYWDENGLRQFCTDYTVLDGSETALAAGWYVADGTVRFDHAVSTTGAVRIILKDGAVMNVGTADSPVSGNTVSVDDSNGSITIYGQKANSGRINAYATDYGFYADGGTVTLVGGHVMASSYSGTVCIADGKSYISEDGIVLSGTLSSEQLAAIAGQTLYPYVEGGAFYLDMNGQRQFSVSCTALTGSETSLAAGWYVADGTVNFDHHITVQGDIHIILKDQAVMNVGTADIPIDGFGIGGSGQYSFSISIYGQSTGTNQGQLKVYATAVGIYAFNGNFNCSSASVTVSASSESSLAIYAHNASFAGTGNLNLKDATVNTTGRKGLYALGGNLTIDGGQVTVEAVEYGIDAQYTNSSGGNVTINGGIVTASGNEYVIFAGGGNITLGWKNSTDRIYASNYVLASYGSCTVSIADGKSFVDEDGNTYSGTLTSDQIEAIAGKTLVPYITTTIAMNDDGIMTYASAYDLDFSAVSGLTAYVASSISGNTLTLTPVEKVPAGTGLLLKGEAGKTFTVPTTGSATAIGSNLLVGLIEETDVSQTTADGIAFILAHGSHGINWYKLKEYQYTLKANSAYLRLSAGVAPSASRALTLVFEDGTTGITTASSLNGGEWFDLNGRKLSKKPTRKGLYIFNGRKTLIK